MARQSGSASFAGTLEVLAGGPLDARSIVPTKADLTASGNFPYYYIGMQAFVVSEKKRYTLIADDPTDIDSWREDGSGGGDSIQVTTMPTASSTLEGVIVQYVGATVPDSYVNGYFYECVSDGESAPTYSWEEKPVQPTSSTLEDSLTATREVGGVTTGMTFEAGTDIETVLRTILNPTDYPTLTPPSATLAATGDKLLEKGATLSTTMTVTFDRGSINPAYGTSGYRSGAASDYSLNGGTAQANNTFSETVTESQLTYTASVSYAAGEQPKDSIGENYDSPLEAGSVNSNTITYEFVDALWSNAASISTIAKESLVSKSTKVKAFAFPAATVANPEIFDVPASWTVTTVEVLNTLSNQWETATSQFTVTDTTHDDAAGSSVNYKRYTCNLGMAIGARSVRIKWS